MRLPTDAPTGTKFQPFTTPPLSSFKKLIVFTPRLLRNLHTISLAKVVPNNLKDCECERITLWDCPLIPYVSKKDSIQETMSALKNDQSLKTQIVEGAELCLSIWLFSCMWDLLMKGSRNGDTSRPTKKPMRPM
jgi:hypothetical protein